MEKAALRPRRHFLARCCLDGQQSHSLGRRTCARQGKRIAEKGRDIHGAIEL
jgi:hypothetical protein